MLAAVLLRVRNQHYKIICAEEARDADNDGIPVIYQTAIAVVTGVAQPTVELVKG